MFLGEEKQEDWLEKFGLPLHVDSLLMFPDLFVELLENVPQFSLLREYFIVR